MREIRKNQMEHVMVKEKRKGIGRKRGFEDMIWWYINGGIAVESHGFVLIGYGRIPKF